MSVCLVLEGVLSQVDHLATVVCELVPVRGCGQ